MKHLLLNALTYFITALVAFPVFWIVLMSFKTEVAAYAIPPEIIFHPVWINYVYAFVTSGYVHYLFNSFRIVVPSVIAAEILGIPLAFFLAQTLKRSGRNGLYGWLLSTKFMPAVGVIIPLYLIYDRLHLLDTALGLGIIYVALALPIVVLIVTSFMEDIPQAILDAALVDGAKAEQLLVRVVVPLVTPGIATSMVLATIFNWNEFFFAVNLTDVHAATVPVFIAGALTSEGLFWSHMAAAATLGFLPIVLLGWIGQRYIVRGLTFGALKE